MLVKKDLWWCGVFDDKLRVFDIVMTTPYGTTYSSYLLKGSKYTVLFETAKATFHQEYEKRIAHAMKEAGVSTIDYIVLNHTEPDHSGSLQYLLDTFPNVTIYATGPALANISHICHRPLKSVEVTPNEIEGEASPISLDVGGYKLRWVICPFLHWPDTMLTWIVPDDKSVEATLVSCDFLGSHYCNPKVFSDLMGDSQTLIDAYKNYYDPIFGPFPRYVKKGLEAIRKGPKIDAVCCSHGPVIRGHADVKKFTDLYEKWSTLPPLEDRVVIAYVSAYGYTKLLAESISEGIKATGVGCDAYDMVDTPAAKILERFGTAKGLLLGTPTIVGEALPPIWSIATALNPIVHQDRVVGVFGSHGWSGEGTRNIQARIDEVRVKAPLEPFEVVFKPTTEDLKNAVEWGRKFGLAVKGECINERKAKVTEKKFKITYPSDGKLRRWKCIVCGEVVIAMIPPLQCAACGASQEAFVCIGLVEAESGPKTDFAGHIVIIGAGAAGISAVKAIREHNDKSTITMISSESELPYYRPMLNKLLVDPKKTRADPAFYLATPAWYTQNKIDLLLNTTVKSIDPASHTVSCETSGKPLTSIKYEKLILATGGNNFIPMTDMLGSNVFGVRTALDVDRLHAFIGALPGGAKDARLVIIGGGLSALETAAALHDLGVKNISIVEMMPRILPRQLTEDGSRLYQTVLAKAGINLYLGVKTKSVEKKGDAIVSIELSNGTRLPVDVVTFSIGTSAETSIAKALKLKVERAIVVNESMEASGLPDIYACGDSAQFKGAYIPTWTTATGTGRTAGLRAVGANQADGATYVPASVPYYIDAFLNIFSIGDITNYAQKTTVAWTNPANDMVELFFNKERKLTGALLMGDCVRSLQTPITMAISNGSSFSEALALVEH